jgi:hypothetical protein
VHSICRSTAIEQPCEGWLLDPANAGKGLPRGSSPESTVKNVAPHEEHE